MDVENQRDIFESLDRIATALERYVGIEESAEYSVRNEIRKRWPGLKSGNVSNEVFARNVAILGKEPDPDTIRSAFEQYEEDDKIDADDLMLLYECDYACASAMLYFGEILLHISPTKDRGVFQVRQAVPEWLLK